MRKPGLREIISQSSNVPFNLNSNEIILLILQDTRLDGL